MQLPSGRTLNATPATFSEALRLRDAIFIELQKISYTDELLKTVAMLCASQKVCEALDICMLRSTIDNEKITKELFSKPEYFEDYTLVQTECIKVNCLPFLKALLASSENIFGK